MQKYLPLIGYLLLVHNLAVLTVFGVDKLLAIRKRKRIPEWVLLFLCFLCGSLGGLLGMLLFRHKTNFKRHPEFVLGVPALLILQLVVSLIAVLQYG